MQQLGFANGQTPSEAGPTEMAPADRSPEGQPANVGLTPPPMANPMPPVAEALPPEANEPPAAGGA